MPDSTATPNVTVSKLAYVAGKNPSSAGMESPATRRVLPQFNPTSNSSSSMAYAPIAAGIQVIEELLVPVVGPNEADVVVPAALAPLAGEQVRLGVTEAGIEALADDFVSMIESSQESNEVLAWQTAQKITDARFKAKFGNRLWTAQHIRAYHELQSGSR